MAAKTPTALVAVIEETPSGDRARFTISVFPSSDTDAVATRAESLRVRFATETGNVVRIVTHGVAA